ncbi:Major head subunit [uncultured Alphaproteobacteria bacterium]|uniref:Major head subunit n=1 Tax=uncultured Alphaproteobacteria bacterium TaxID=91750 RepID=A0A212JNQ1_9PROT|nr:Major head subunit [uncultured Alphaproteobacteria bacterium]
MIINSNSLDLVCQGFRTVFNNAFSAATPQYEKIAMVVSSATREETYGWLGEFPSLREWIAERVYKNLKAHAFTIKNRDFEATVQVRRNDIEDDRYGVYAPLFSEMGRSTASHPDELIFGLLASGFSETCYDGQYFFDADHLMVVDDQEVSISNLQLPDEEKEEEEGPAWFLLDTSREVKPLIFQKRRAYQFVVRDNISVDDVFEKKLLTYSVDARLNVGFGLWQLAFGSKAPLTKANYEAARSSMMGLKGDYGRPLGITPTVLVVPPSLEGTARRLLKATVNGGEANEWAGSAELIVSHHL